MTDYIFGPFWVFLLLGLCLLIGGGCAGVLIAVIIEEMKNGK